MRATAEQLEGNQVRVSLEVDEAEVDAAVQDAVRRLSRQLRVPGFRPGKVPRQVLEARLGGKAALRTEALREALPDLLQRAVEEADLDPIAPPRVEDLSPPPTGPVSIDAVIEVRPRVSIPGYSGLEVTIPSIEVTDEDVAAQLDRLRQQSGQLSPVDRPIGAGDFVTIDVEGAEAGGEAVDLQDYLYELGSGTGPPGLDEKLIGHVPGDVVELVVPSEEGSAGGSEGGSGEDAPSATYRVAVKEVQEKILPEASDEWAAEVSEFSTLKELEDDVRKRIREVRVATARLVLRERALEALVALVVEDPPVSMVESELADSLRDLGRELEAHRISVRSYVEATGRSEEELVAEMRERAVRAVRADLALRALADAEGIEVDDADLDELFRSFAKTSGRSPEAERERIERAGRLAAVRSEQRKAKALSWLVEHVAIVDEEGRPVSRSELVAGPEGEGQEPKGGADGVGTPEAGAGREPGAEGSEVETAGAESAESMEDGQ